MTPPPSRWAASRTTAGGSCPETSSAAFRATSATATCHAAEAVERGAVGLLCEHFIPELFEHDVVQTRIARGHDASRHGPAGGCLLRLPGAGSPDDRRDGHQRQDDRDAAPGRPPHRDRPAHQRHGHPLGRPDHAGGHRDPTGPGRRARPPEVRRRPPRGGHGGVQPRPRPITGGGHPLRRRRLHQPQPRPPRLPRDDGGVLRGESHALHPRSCLARRRQRGRSVGAAAARTRPHPDRRRAATATPATSCCGRATPSSPGAANGSRPR